jgi:hypothetical protein
MRHAAGFRRLFRAATMRVVKTFPQALDFPRAADRSPVWHRLCKDYPTAFAEKRHIGRKP